MNSLNKVCHGLLVFTLVAALLFVCGSVFAARPAPLPQRVDIVANTAYSLDAGEYCVVTIKEETGEYAGSCSDVAKQIYNELRGEYPLVAFTVTINGLEVNRI